jgi:TPR repeat protein
MDLLSNHSQLYKMVKFRNCAWLACTVALLIQTGCVPIPISTEPNSTDVQQASKHAGQYASLLKSTKVTHSHRYGIGTQLTKAMQNGSNEIEIIDSREICQEVLPKHDPDADILLEELLMEDVRNRILSQGIQFLVVLTPMRTGTIDNDCRFWPCGTFIESTNLSSTLIDIEENKILEGFAITASGKGGGVWIPAWYLLFTYPHVDPATEKSVTNTMAERIAERISEKTEGKPTRIMVVEEVPSYVTALRREKSNDEVYLQFYYNTVEADSTSAHRWLCKSADQGNSEARYRLGMLYENGGEGIRKDYVSSYLWYVLSSQSGSYWGGRHALRLRENHLNAESITAAENMVAAWQPGQCEIDLALDIFKERAARGDPDAQWKLYKLNKYHGEYDFKWLCKAAEQGDYRAQWELGYLHGYGLYGVRKDLVLSLMYYSLVEAAGHDPKGVDNMRKQLSPEQLTEAEHLYESWKPGRCEREILGPKSSDTY